MRPGVDARPALASGDGLDAGGRASNEFGGVQLGNGRRDARLVASLRHMA